VSLSSRGPLFPSYFPLALSPPTIFVTPPCSRFPVPSGSTLQTWVSQRFQAFSFLLSPHTIGLVPARGSFFDPFCRLFPDIYVRPPELLPLSIFLQHFHPFPLFFRLDQVAFFFAFSLTGEVNCTPGQPNSRRRTGPLPVSVFVPPILFRPHGDSCATKRELC